MSREARSMRCPESVLGWIPWYGEADAQGASLLDSRQRGTVEAHAAECTECRAELDMISGAPFEIDVDLPDPDRMFDEITARIEAGEAEGVDTAPVFPSSGDATAPRRPVGASREAQVVPIEAAGPMTDDEVRKLTRWVLEGERAVEPDRQPAPGASRVVRGPWGLRPAAAVAAAAAIFVLGLFGGVVVDGTLGQADEYRLASAPGSATASAGPLLDVVFVDGATAGEIREGLRAAGLEIVSGPSSVGRYRLRATGVEGPGTAADLQVIVSRLKEGPKPLALFAEPASP